MVKRQPNPFFKFREFTIFQDKCAMKVGTDGVLLGAWVDVTNARNGLDIGTGTGLIAIMMAQRNSNLHVDAIDIDAEAVAQTEGNALQSPFRDRISIQKTSLQDFSSDKKYDIIASNPPFFNDSLKSPNEQRTLARHTDSLLVEELICAASKLLSEKGKLSIIYPFEYKTKLITLAKRYNLCIIRITNVLPTPQSAPKRILMELSGNKSSLIENDLVIETERHIYSDEFNKLTEKFYLKK